MARSHLKCERTNDFSYGEIAVNRIPSTSWELPDGRSWSFAGTSEHSCMLKHINHIFSRSTEFVCTCLRSFLFQSVDLFCFCPDCYRQCLARGEAPTCRRQKPCLRREGSHSYYRKLLVITLEVEQRTRHRANQ